MKQDIKWYWWRSGRHFPWEPIRVVKRIPDGVLVVDCGFHQYVSMEQYGGQWGPECSGMPNE